MFNPEDDIYNEISITRPKINMYMLVMFFILTIPILAYSAFRYLDRSAFDFFINSRDEGRIEKFIHSGEKNNHPEKEQLKNLCEEFLSITGKYGYTPKDVINEIKQH